MDDSQATWVTHENETPGHRPTYRKDDRDEGARLDALVDANSSTPSHPTFAEPGCIPNWVYQIGSTKLGVAVTSRGWISLNLSYRVSHHTDAGLHKTYPHQLFTKQGLETIMRIAWEPKISLLFRRDRLVRLHIRSPASVFETWPRFVALSSHAPLNIDDFYEYYDPNEESELVSQRQKSSATPDSQKLILNTAQSRPRSQPPRRRTGTEVRQQRSPSPPSRPPTSSSNRLRRTPRLPERRPSLVRATSLPPTFEVFQQVAPDSIKPTRTTSADLGDDLPEQHFAPSIASSEQYQRIVADESFWPRRSTQISQSTHEAILFAIEAVRRGRGNNYWTFTPDLVEENASMSDLTGGRAPIGSTARAQNGGTRAASGPVPVSERTPERLRTPTDVMRHARARIARQEAEKEASRVQQLEERERRRREIELASTGPTQQRRSGGRRPGGEPQFDPQAQPSAEATVQRRSGERRSGGEAQVDPQGVQQSTTQPTTAPTTRPRGPSLDQGQPRPVQTQTQPQVRVSTTQQPSAPRISRTEPGRTANLDGGDIPQKEGPSERQGRRPQPVRQPVRQAAQQAQAEPAQGQTQGQTQQRAPFPHAFERWETLSSHWEGLTSYWIRRLQENSNELSREPLSQQMSRQITDLSAAGANLFHAVVELQRLRASSERKFSRWFFEHRSDQERFQDTQAQLERTLQTERQNREDALASKNAAEAETMKAQELVKEMRRELQISKEEARRAWEELGRREQVEREWTVSLQNGQPTIVGGVQVVPMTQGVPSRRTSTRERPPTREGPYAGGPGPGSMGGQRRDPADYPRGYDGQFLQGGQSSPTETDPFSATDPTHPPYAPEEYYTQRTQPPTSSAAIAARTAASPSGSYPAPQQPGRFYQQADPMLQTTATTEPSMSDTGRSYIPSTLSAGSDEEAVEYEIDAQGNYALDSQGRRIPYRGPRSDEGSDSQGDVRAEAERDRIFRERYGQPSSAAYQVPAPAPDVPIGGGGRYEHPPSSQVDYSGQAWGSGWESITPRHRHPTRLSDVLEEDERSRATSPTRASYVGSGAESGHASTRLVGIREEEQQPSTGRTKGE